MKIKIIEATKEERTNLFNFLINRHRTDCETYQMGVEVDEYLDLIKDSISIQKFEVELNDIIKIIFNRISFMESHLPDNEFVLENGQGVIKSTGKILHSITHYSSFYEFEDNKFIDITQDDFISFDY